MSELKSWIVMNMLNYINKSVITIEIAGCNQPSGFISDNMPAFVTLLTN